MARAGWRDCRQGRAHPRQQPKGWKALCEQCGYVHRYKAFPWQRSLWLSRNDPSNPHMLSLQDMTKTNLGRQQSLPTPYVVHTKVFHAHGFLSPFAHPGTATRSSPPPLPPLAPRAAPATCPLPWSRSFTQLQGWNHESCASGVEELLRLSGRCIRVWKEL